MEIYHVVARARNGVIGRDNQLPWHFSSDLKAFKALTTGHTILMGRKTFESIGRALPGRENFVLSRHPAPEPAASGVRFFSSVESAVGAVKTERLFVIGGAEIYAQTLNLAEGIYLTEIHAEYEGDAFYPGLSSAFREVSRECLQEKDPKIERVFYARSL